MSRRVCLKCGYEYMTGGRGSGQTHSVKSCHKCCVVNPDVLRFARALLAGDVV